MESKKEKNKQTNYLLLIELNMICNRCHFAPLSCLSSMKKKTFIFKFSNSNFRMANIKQKHTHTHIYTMNYLNYNNKKIHILRNDGKLRSSHTKKNKY